MSDSISLKRKVHNDDTLTNVAGSCVPSAQKLQKIYARGWYILNTQLDKIVNFAHCRFIIICHVLAFALRKGEKIFDHYF